MNSPVFSISQSKENYQTLIESIQALDITRTKFKEKLLSINQFQNQSLHHEYSVFIEYLSFRIKKYCSQISQSYNENLFDDLPCHLNNKSRQQYDKSQYVTSEEKIQSLDEELMNSLGDFDEMLLKEEQMIAQTQKSRKTTANEGSASGENTADGQKGQSYKNEQGNNNSQEESYESTQNNEQSENNEKSGGKGKGKTKGDGSKKYKRMKLDKIDDDIVARQLKEAAEKETNPDLKEKLWDEYYKYKQNKLK